MIATRGHFPARLGEAITQKARWITGIALCGWDRMGWTGGLAERWMRLRDRQSVIAAVLVAAAYVGILCHGVLSVLAPWAGRAIEPVAGWFLLLISVTTILLVWRLVVRFLFVAHEHGLVEGLRSLPRALLGNAIAILAAWRALGRYRSGRLAGWHRWDKTVHIFPRSVPVE